MSPHSHRIRLSLAALLLLISVVALATAAGASGADPNCRGNAAKKDCPVLTPAEGATVLGTTRLTAVPPSAVAGITFMLDGQALATEDTVAPYELDWDTTKAANGAHTIAAQSRMTTGELRTTENAVSIANPTPDSKAPSVAVSAPAPGSSVSSTVTVSAAASDDVAVAGVQFKLDGANVGAEDVTSPYSLTWDTTTVPNGTHTLSATARDTSGNLATAAGVTVTVGNAAATADTAPPAVTLTSPSSGTTVSGAVSVTANATDNIGVASVQFKVDGTNVGAADTAAPYAMSWDTTTAANGTRTITAVARDAAGNATTSAQLAVSVQNAAPATAPPAGATQLSSLTPTSATSGWGPYETNRSNGEKAAGDGRTITLNGTTYASGLGVHGASELRYGVAGCSRFQADVGLDDEVGANGGVVFQVFADATKLYDSGLMTGSTATKQIDVALTGAAELRLVVTDGGNGAAYDHGDWANARVECSTSSGTGGTSPPPPPPPTTTTSGLPFPEAAMRTGYKSLTVPATTSSITCPKGYDCMIDLQKTKRGGSLLIYGYSGSNIKVVNGYWDVSSSRSSVGPYWRGGPRVRSSDGIGPDHVSLTDMFITGSTLADGIAVDAGTNTRVTVQRTRIESPSVVTGSNAPEAAEHLDALQIQGKIKQLDVGLSTFYAASVAPPNHGGKALMLGGSAVGNTAGYTVNLSSFNMRGPGTNTGCFVVQDQRNIVVNMSDTWAAKEGAGTYLWTSGSGLFLAYQATTQWTSNGTAPNRTATFASGLGFSGMIREGIPGGQDFITRSTLGY